MPLDIQDPITFTKPEIHDILPFEIISQIFDLAVPHYNIHKTGRSFRKIPVAPLTIASVCRTWKGIAWNTPQLWTYLVFDLQRYTNKVENAAQRFEQRLQRLDNWISRSGNTLPLSISIVENVGKYGASLDIMDTLFSRLAQYSFRWENIHAHIFAPGHSELAKLIQNAVNLRTFSLKLSNLPRPIFDTDKLGLQKHPCLTTLSLNFVPLTLICTNWPKVTYIRLRHFGAAECLKTLALTTNLVYLDLRFLCFDPTHLGGPVHLPCLQYFDWYCCAKSGELNGWEMQSFANKLQTPTLRGFRWLSKLLLYFPLNGTGLLNGCVSSLRLVIVGYRNDYNDRDEETLLDLWARSPHLAVIYIPLDKISDVRTKVPPITDDTYRLFENPKTECWKSAGYCLPPMNP